MVFTVSSVVLSFALGIAVSNIYISTMKTLGKGFYLMMNLIAIGFIFLSFISTDITLIKVIDIVASLSIGILILYLYNNHKIFSLRPALLQNIFYVFTIILLVSTLVLEAKNTANISNIFFEIIRLITGALLLGGSLTAMLLGHWYLIQPGLNRQPIKKMSELCLIVLIIVALGWLFKPSMLQVFTGTIDDGWQGMLANMWLAATLTSLVILLMARKALSERSYSAVMATTGLLYLVILLAEGVELIPRSIFS